MTYDKYRPRVAYFCMEYGLDESLPIYAGGLGVLAGDILKTAFDLKLPFIGIGILWKEGYTTQLINEHGWPYDRPATYTRDTLQDIGITIHITIRGEQVPVRVWRVDSFGNAPLYLLDTAVPGSSYDWVTRRLYGGTPQDRIAQEIVLGIGGIRALEALGHTVDVYHFNEGHAVLAGIELIRRKKAKGLTFDEALEATRREVVFTTHTPVMAGNEEHEHSLLRYMGAYDGLSWEEMRRIGDEPFNMTVAGLRLAHLANGVSKLHGMTARAMWSDKDDRAPIVAITNGVHVDTWMHPNMRRAYESRLGLWAPHTQAKRELLQAIAKRTGVQLNPQSLLIGFARRAAMYKRPDLIFQRMDIIGPLLESGRVQMVFSGKTHPQDESSKHLVSKITEITQYFPQSVVFLENYDMELGRLLTAGCDVWLNNPQRPLEASGTSGIKAALNGCLNLSVLDGWWIEGCQHGVNGWQFGGGYEGHNQSQYDLASLYEMLLQEVLPTYYENPSRWQNMMLASINTAYHRFSSQRMLTEYYNILYQPSRTVKLLAEEIEQVMIGTLH
ncbi:MAG: alpha-glucan family phosphorylase [Firmicutes bacterium]|nr:alpha-glucan family phosphorylase [Bacillota bacterium]